MITFEEFEKTYEDSPSMPPYHWYTVGYEQGEYDVDEWVSRCSDLAGENAMLKVRNELLENRIKRKQYRKEPISEEELDKLAKEYIKDKKEPSMRIASYNGFRTGFCKAMEGIV